MNDTLREHVTSVGFSLTLTKAQIELLVMLDHFGGHDKMSRSGHSPIHYVSTIRSLDRRGLTDRNLRSGKLTEAGRLMCGLLREAGMYDEALDRRGIARSAA